MAGTEYFLSVDGFGGDFGPYVLDVLCPSTTAEVCTNVIDDDGDGAVDCDDSECFGDAACTVEMCTNGFDDDGDNLLDCLDPDCYVAWGGTGQPHASCGPEICGDGIDNNVNGLTDCDDPQCILTPACLPEICTNGVDDDFDGDVDCDDVECQGNVNCPPPACSVSLGTVACGGSVTGTTAGAANTVTNYSCSNTSPGPDVVYTFNSLAAELATFSLQITTPNTDLDLVVMAEQGGGCDGNECEAFAGSATLNPEALVVQVGAGSTYYVSVDSKGAGSAGAFTLSLACGATPGAEFCTNGLDDDGDGLVDCNDPVCTAHPACLVAAEVCTDGVDNDGDGLVDCSDPDCFTQPGCALVELCDDGTDNDADGLVDCQDIDCIGDINCVGIETCTDGVDNSSNGLIDCQDPTCAGGPLCSTEISCTNGFDDDGDGDIDCLDSDCSSLPVCAP
jgi:hypothetical protein